MVTPQTDSTNMEVWGSNWDVGAHLALAMLEKIAVPSLDFNEIVLGRQEFPDAGEHTEGSYRETRLQQITMQIRPLEVAERLREIGNLEPDWDGYGSSRISLDAIASTATYICRLQNLNFKIEDPFVAPLADGGIEMEWGPEPGGELIIVIPPSGDSVRYLQRLVTSEGQRAENAGLVESESRFLELLVALNH